MRTIVVTGSASGIGAAIRRRLEADGERVVGIDLGGQEIDADLSTPAGRRAACDEVRGCTDVVHGVALCAGLGPHVLPTSKLVAVNYFGAVETLDLLLPMMTEPDAAAVVIASNSIGLIPGEGYAVVDAMLDHDEPTALALGDEIEGAVLYGLTKQALARAVRRRARAWGEAGVRLNAVAPGPVLTPLLQGSLDDPMLGPLVDALPVPLHRRGSPEEVADVVTYLLGPDTAFVHGAVWFVDGGTDAETRPDHI